MAFLKQPAAFKLSSQAFTLVELAVVLVIIGLLVGGVLSGQALIRAAELRSITAQQANIVTAVQTFRDKYFGLPGDIVNAGTLWSTTVGGDGNGRIGQYPQGVPEEWQFWQQLALAGLIPGNYTGTVQSPMACGGTGPGAAFYANNRRAAPGVNVLASKIANAGWTAVSIDPSNWTSSAPGLPLLDGNLLIFGTAGICETQGAAITPGEAWNVDTKVDDGNPVTGDVVDFTGGGVSINNSCTIASGTTGAYYLANNNIACALAFVTGF